MAVHVGEAVSERVPHVPLTSGSVPALNAKSSARPQAQSLLARQLSSARCFASGRKLCSTEARASQPIAALRACAPPAQSATATSGTLDAALSTHSSVIRAQRAPAASRQRSRESSCARNVPLTGAHDPYPAAGPQSAAASATSRHRVSSCPAEPDTLPAECVPAPAPAPPPPRRPSFQMHGKNIVRVSPALLGRIGEAAEAVSEGSLIVQFVGRCTQYNQDVEWHVTHAILSNSLAVSSHETRAQRNEQVDDVMREHQLTHIGWLRQASVSCPLSTLDLDTQRLCTFVSENVPNNADHTVLVQVYEEHLPDAFAAMLDLSQSEAGPMVYFYCLSNPRAAPSDIGYNAFAAAHHVVLDTSVPFGVVEVSLSGGSAPAESQPAPMEEVQKAPQSYATKDSGTTNGTASTRMHMRQAGSANAVPEDESMCMSQG